MIGQESGLGAKNPCSTLSVGGVGGEESSVQEAISPTFNIVLFFSYFHAYEQL